MGPATVRVNEVDLCVETVGDRADPAILLVMGAGASMDWWQDDFCARLAAGPRYVIRYDHRDTGQSTSYPPGEPGYTGDDLVADAAALLAVLGVRRAHVVGQSAGGALAQLVALDHPACVASLTLVATSPAGPDPDLPPRSDEAGAANAASRSRPFDAQQTRALCARVVERTTNMESSTKNAYAAEGSDRWRERLGGLDVPTLVVHGTEDPLFPLGHGEALAREIPGAELLVLEGAGHELARRDWDVVVPAILRLTRS